jgi:hypothetical protein
MKKITIKTKNVSIFIVGIFILLSLFLISIALNTNQGSHTLQDLSMDSSGSLPIAESYGNNIIFVDSSSLATQSSQALYVRNLSDYKAYYSKPPVGTNSLCIQYYKSFLNCIAFNTIT